MKARFDKSLKHAIEGIKVCYLRERNMKIHIFIMMCVMICGFVFHIAYFEWIICLLLFAIVISLELVNTAVEAVVDLCSPQIHPLAKYAKDVAAGAVLVSAILATVIGLLIFIPKIL